MLPRVAHRLFPRQNRRAELICRTPGAPRLVRLPAYLPAAAMPLADFTLLSGRLSIAAAGRLYTHFVRAPCYALPQYLPIPLKAMN